MTFGHAGSIGGLGPENCTCSRARGTSTGPLGFFRVRRDAPILTPGNALHLGTRILSARSAGLPKTMRAAKLQPE